MLFSLSSLRELTQSSLSPYSSILALTDSTYLSKSS